MIALLGLLLGAAAPAETPAAFVDRLYAGHRDPDYSPLARPERVFAEPLVAASVGRAEPPRKPPPLQQPAPVALTVIPAKAGTPGREVSAISPGPRFRVPIKILL